MPKFDVKIVKNSKKKDVAYYQQKAQLKELYVKDPSMANSERSSRRKL